MNAKIVEKKIRKWSKFLEEAAICKAKVYPVGTQFVYDEGSLPSGMTGISAGDILNLQRENGMSSYDVPGSAEDWVRIDGNPGDGSGLDLTVEQTLTAAQKQTVAQNINGRPVQVDSETEAVVSMGYKVLNPAKSFVEQVTAANTIYEIKDEFGLGGGSVIIPVGCTLRFNGGKLVNGLVNLNGGKIEAGEVKIFDTIKIRNTNYVSVHWFGAVGDGSHDDTAAFESVADWANNSTITPNIHIPQGHYILKRKFSITKDCTIQGNGISSFLDFSTVYTRGVELGSNADSLEELEISNVDISTFVKGSISIKLTAELNAGDVIIIHNNRNYSYCRARYYYTEGEIHKIESVTTVNGVSTVVLDSGLYASFEASNLKVYRLNTVTINVSNIRVLVKEQGEGTIALSVYGGVDSVIKNIYASGTQKANINVEHCYNVNINGSTVDYKALDNNTGYGYGLCINNSQNITVNNCRFKTTRHGITTGGNDKVVCRNITINNSYVESYNDVAIGLHGNTEYMNINNSTIIRGIGLCGNHVSVNNCTIYSKNLYCIKVSSELVGYDFTVNGCTFVCDDVRNGRIYMTLLSSPYISGESGIVSFVNCNMQLDCRNTAPVVLAAPRGLALGLDYYAYPWQNENDEEDTVYTVSGNNTRWKNTGGVYDITWFDNEPLYDTEDNYIGFADSVTKQGDVSTLQFNGKTYIFKGKSEEDSTATEGTDYKIIYPKGSKFIIDSCNFELQNVEHFTNGTRDGFARGSLFGNWDIEIKNSTLINMAFEVKYPKQGLVIKNNKLIANSYTVGGYFISSAARYQKDSKDKYEEETKNDIRFEGNVVENFNNLFYKSGGYVEVQEEIDEETVTVNKYIKLFNSVDIEGNTFIVTKNNCMGAVRLSASDDTDIRFVNNTMSIANGVVISTSAYMLYGDVNNVYLYDNKYQGEVPRFGFAKVNQIISDRDFRGATANGSLLRGKGLPYYHGILNKPIWWDGESFIDSTLKSANISPNEFITDSSAQIRSFVCYSENAMQSGMTYNKYQLFRNKNIVWKKEIRSSGIVNVTPTYHGLGDYIYIPQGSTKVVITGVQSSANAIDGYAFFTTSKSFISDSFKQYDKYDNDGTKEIIASKVYTIDVPDSIQSNGGYFNYTLWDGINVDIPVLILCESCTNWVTVTYSRGHNMVNVTLTENTSREDRECLIVWTVANKEVLRLPVTQHGVVPAERGNTASRPSSILTVDDAGFRYFDTDLGKPIFWNGTAWVDANGFLLSEIQVSDKSVLLAAAANSSNTIEVYTSDTPTIAVKNPDDTDASDWLSASLSGTTLTVTATTANATNPRGGKVILTNTTDEVVISVVQNYV